MSGEGDFDLDLDEGVGQYDDVEGEDNDRQDITSADPEWGTETATSEETDASVEGGSTTTEASSDADSSDATGEVSVRTGGMSVSELATSSSMRAALFDDVSIPGTDYEGMEYVFQRMGKEKTKFDRPGERRFNTFEQTEEQLNRLMDWLNEEVYPETTVLKADVLEAALLCGIYNPDQIKEILDAWGYQKMENR